MTSISMTAREFIKEYSIGLYSIAGYGVAYFLIEEDALEFEYLVRREAHYYPKGVFEGYEHSRRPNLDRLFFDTLKGYATTFDLDLIKTKKTD